MAGTNGMATALELAGGIGQLSQDDEQPELFADADDAPSPLTPAKSGPKGGRPKGARNRSTEQWRSFLLARYRSPLAGLLEIAGRSARDLALELDLVARDECGVPVLGEDGEPVLAPGALLEALKVQKSAMEACLPYLHQKQPLAVEAKGDGLRGGMFVVQFAGHGEQSDGFGIPVIEGLQNQSLSHNLAEQSDDDRSDGEAK